MKSCLPFGWSIQESEKIQQKPASQCYGSFFGLPAQTIISVRIIHFKQF